MKLVSLISGGIDSPVASYMMSKAGADIVLLHMDLGEYGDPAISEKAVRLAEQLEKVTGKEFPLYSADHGTNERILIENADRNYTCVLCKRTMQNVAKKFAQSIGASGIVMGDSLGQVASQTLMNIRAEQKDLGFPIVRPLIGLDKVEIIDIAERIGTYDISIMKSGGCLAVPVKPVTEAKPEKVEEFTSGFDFDGMIDDCVAGIRRIHRGSPYGRTRREEGPAHTGRRRQATRGLRAPGEDLTVDSGPRSRIRIRGVLVREREIPCQEVRVVRLG